jgi:hypothetical protein
VEGAEVNKYLGPLRARREEIKVRGCIPSKRACFNWESSLGVDLNGDEDIDDPIVGYYMIPPDFVIPEFARAFCTIMTMIASMSALTALSYYKRKR